MSVQALSLRLWREVRSYGPAIRRFRRNPQLYLLHVLTYGSAINIVGLLLNLYLLELGFGEAFVGQAISAGFLGQMLGGIPGGILYHRRGGRMAFASSIAITVLAWGLLVLAPAPGLLLAAAFVGGFGNALTFTTTYPFISDESGEQERPYLFGSNAIAWTIAETVGSFVGGLLPALFQSALLLTSLAAGYRAGIAASILLALIASFPILAMQRGRSSAVEVSPHAPTTSPLRDDRRAFYGAAVAVFFLGLCMGLSYPFFNVYFSQFHHASSGQVGGIIAASRLLSLVTFFLMPILMQRFGHVTLITVCGLASAPFLLLLGFPVPLGMAVVILLAAMLASRLSVFVLFILTVESVGPRLRGRQSSARVVVNALSMSLAGVLGGWLITRLGYGWLFGLAAGGATLGALAVWYFFRHNPLVNGRRRLGAP